MPGRVTEKHVFEPFLCPQNTVDRRKQLSWQNEARMVQELLKSQESFISKNIADK